MKSTMPFHQRVLQTFLDRLRFATLPPRPALCPFALTRLGEIDQPFGRIVAAIQQHIFDAFPQFRFDLFVNGELAGVHDRPCRVRPGWRETRNAACIASRTVLLPRNENEMLLMPPLMRAPGRFSLIQRVASMKSTA